MGIRGLPDELDENLCRTVRETFDRHGIRLAAVSATFNAIHPDRALRQQEIRVVPSGSSRVPCPGNQRCNALHRHSRPEAICGGGIPTMARPRLGADLLDTLDALVPAAEDQGVVLGIEPEQANVIDSAVKARRLLDEVKSKQLRIILDGANLFDPHDLERHGGRSCSRHLTFWGRTSRWFMPRTSPATRAEKDQAAGTGKLDWPTYFRLMKGCGFDGPLLLHNLKPSQVATSIQFICREAAPWYPRTETFGGRRVNQFFLHDGIRFRYQATGSGLPVVFCHGLGGDLEASEELLASPRATGSSSGTAAATVAQNRWGRWRTDVCVDG